MATVWYDTGGTSSTSTTTVWTSWCSTSTTATTATTCSTYTTQVWLTWCDGTLVRTQQLSEEQRAYNMQLAAEVTARHQENERKRIEAEARAEKLLLENLDLKQRLDYEKSKSFVVHGQAGWRFRIRAGRMGNVDAIDKTGRVKHRLCAHPNVMLPNCDTMLAQKLLLEDNQDAFIRIANKHAVINPETQVLEAVE